MKDFLLRNDTKLLFRNNPVETLAELTENKNVLFVFGGGSVKKNGCYADVKQAVAESNGKLFEFGKASREFADIEHGIQIAKENNIELVIGAGAVQVSWTVRN